MHINVTVWPSLTHLWGVTIHVSVPCGRDLHRFFKACVHALPVLRGQGMGRRNHGGTSHVWKTPLMNRIDWIVGVIQPILKIIVYYVIHGRFFFFLSIQTILMSFQFNGRYIINTFAAHPQIKNFFSISQILRLVNISQTKHFKSNYTNNTSPRLDHWTTQHTPK